MPIELPLTTPASIPTAVNGVYTTPVRDAKASNTLDKDAFLKLLVTQMTYQDPSSPMDTSQLMAQTTQMASMEQLTELTKTGQENFALQMRIAAQGLVGKSISYVADDGTTASGTVESVSYAYSVPTVSVDGKSVSLDRVSEVSSKTPAAPTPAA